MFNPSLIEPLHFSLFGQTHTIDILRDDLIHPLVSGNKWRKLKHIIADVQKRHKNHIVTFGGAYSNHLVATAVAGKLFGIKTTAFVRGDEQRELNRYEQICLENDMHLIHVSRHSYKDKIELFKHHFENDISAEMVGEGGQHPMAIKGCEEILDDADTIYDYIILSVGTGTTMSGIVKRVYNSRLPTVVIGISSLKNNFELNRILSVYPNQYWQIEHNYHRGKYAKNDVDLIHFIEAFFRETGIRLEHVYTGKMMMALTYLIQSQRIPQGSKILCIHTGGLPEIQKSNI